MMSLNRRFWSRKVLFTVGLLSLASAILLASHIDGIFEVDGDLVATSSQDFGPAAGGMNALIPTSDPLMIVANASPPTAVDNPAAPGIATLFYDDISTSSLVDSSTFTQGSKETSEAIPPPTPSGPIDWEIVSGNVPPNKDDISLVYTWIDDAFEKLVMAMERLNVLGDSHLDFALDQNPWVPCPNDADSLCPDHEEGDILLAFDLAQGGSVPTARLFVWEEPGGADVGAAFPAGGGTTGCDGAITGGGNLRKSCIDSRIGAGEYGWEEVGIPANVIEVRLNDSGPIMAGPWGSFGQGGEIRTMIPTNGYFEVFVDLLALGFEPHCPVFGTASVRSRSSDSIDSALKDLAGPIDLGIDCKISGTKWEDLNADGVMQENEPPIEGFTINLSGDGSGSTVTDENGFYEFTGLMFGSYTVSEICPSLQGWRQTFPPPLTGEAGCGDNTQSATLSLVTPTAEDRDFGNVKLPDVTVSKTADNSPINAGETAGFSITVSNIGPGRANDVDLDDTLPDGGLVWTEVPDMAECAITGSQLHCDISYLDPGESFTVNIEATTSAIDCGMLPNTATVGAANEPADSQGNNSDDDTITVQCPDVTVVKTADNSPINAGDDASFTITISNLGPGTAFDPTLHDPLPAGIAWSIIGGTGASYCAIVSNELDCAFPDMASGDSFMVQVSGATDAADCGELPNTATVAASNEAEADTGNNMDSDTVTVQCPDVTVTKTADNSPISAGDDASFTITVTNNGPGTAVEPTLNDPLPAGIAWSIIGGTGQSYCSIVSNTLSCAFPDMATGASYSVQVSGTTDAADCGSLPNTATVGAGNEPSGSTGNNMDSDTVVVQCPDVTVMKSPDGGEIPVGDKAVFTIVVTNNGPGSAVGVTLDDPLPDGGLTWVENPDKTECTVTGGNSLHCDIGTLASGATFSVTVEAQTDGPEDCRLLPNTATVAATNEPAANAGNNSDDGDINVRCPGGKIAPTQTTCQDFVAGTAADLTEVGYGVKSSLINNTHPGVFFYYTTVVAPSSSFTVNLVQTNNNMAVPFFDVQAGSGSGVQVRLFTSDCQTSVLGMMGASNGQATAMISGATAGQVFIISAKYETTTVVGEPEPSPSTVHYDFATMVGIEVVDQDADGLNLVKD